MKRPLFLVTLLLALAVPPSAEAGGLLRFVAGTTKALSLERGTGMAVVRASEGAMIGSVRRGRVVVVDVRRGTRTRVRLYGCERRRTPRARTTLCAGTAIRFSVLGGAWRVSLLGRGINASARVRGSVTLKGTAGKFRIGNRARRNWPRVAHTYLLRG